MDIRITGISTPFGGVSWEYANKENNENNEKFLMVKRKIKVFISSKCGGKYDNVRLKLKETIENTNLAEVYLFEEAEASTLSAIDHYSLALQECDVCIFLIDNKDGISSGVQREIDIVNKYKIKALYYFCDENSKEKTILEKRLIGEQYSKTKTIHKFDELSDHGAIALIEDIIQIYHCYCKYCRENNSEFQNLFYKEFGKNGIERSLSDIIPKSILKNIPKATKYIAEKVLLIDTNYTAIDNNKVGENKIDEWVERFLLVLFERKNIKEFNVGMLLEVLKEEQSNKYNEVVYKRWQSIQAYFAGDVENSFQYQKGALKLAKNYKLPSWIISDILIDLKNLENEICSLDNKVIVDSNIQKEIVNSREMIYYPILDRIHESMLERYVKELYKDRIKSPHTITFGNSLNEYSEFFASSLIVSMYNGSLTQLLLFHNNIKEFLFYLTCKFNNWSFKRDLLKYAIYLCQEQEIAKIINTYPEILNNLNDSDADIIIKFSYNHPMESKRIETFMYAFGVVGYYLDNNKFDEYEKVFWNYVERSFQDKQKFEKISNIILFSISRLAYRLSQNKMAEICCAFIENNLWRSYTSLFIFMANYIDLKEMDLNIADRLIGNVIKVIEDSDKRRFIKHAPAFLWILRNQNKNITELMDEKVSKYLPEIYNGYYKFAIHSNSNWNNYIRAIIQNIQKRNQEQGKNGKYNGFPSNDIINLRFMLLQKDFNIDDNVMDLLIETVIDTLTKSKDHIEVKLSAISFLICVVFKYEKSYIRNRNKFLNILKNKEKIEEIETPFILSNINKISLKISLQILFVAMNEYQYTDVLELAPYFNHDIPTTISISKIIAEYLEIDNTILFPEKVEAIVLQNVLQWINSDNLEIRWNGTRILLNMLRNPENINIVNNILIKLIDNDNVYIKNLIISNLYKTDKILDETKAYILKKCQNDTNYVVRMVCEKEIVKNKNLYNDLAE